MLMIKTHIASSPIHGIGLFADENIPKGTHIWGLDKMIDRKISPTDRLHDIMQRNYKLFLSRYAYFIDDGSFILCMDDARFMNHSSKPNTYNTSNSGTYALRDILLGEELTCNYFEFDAHADKKHLFQENGI